MQRDHLDKVVEQWQHARPDLDSQPMAVVGRILRLAGLLEQRANVALQPFGLAIWGFDVLGTLRRQGKPYALTPTELMQATMLSSGAMTNRIDRLEKLGLVERTPHEHDRRSLLVTLTSKGLRVVDQAAMARFDETRAALQQIPSAEQASLARSLRKILIQLEPELDGPNG
jgi:DNA-binding MarR family transcriptional regulator